MAITTTDGKSVSIEFRLKQMKRRKIYMFNRRNVQLNASTNQTKDQNFDFEDEDYENDGGEMIQYHLMEQHIGHQYQRYLMMIGLSYLLICFKVML